MKSAVLLLLSFAILSSAEDRKPEDQKRLQSVTWDLKTHKLVWVVEKGVERDGNFVPNGSDRYEISPDEASMSFLKEKRGFTREEANSLHKLLDTLSLYCAESVVWWDKGEGVPMDPDSGEKPKRHKVEHDPPPIRTAPPKPQLVAQTPQSR